MGISPKDGYSSGIPPVPASKGSPINVFYLKPMVSNDLLENFEYDIEIVKWVDDSTKDNKINKMILRPIEAGNMIELHRGKTAEVTITSGTLHAMNLVEATKRGLFMKKKQDLLLEIQFYMNETAKTRAGSIFYPVKCRGQASPRDTTIYTRNKRSRKY